MNIRSAYRLAIIGSRREIAKQLRRGHSNEPAMTMLRAVLAQYSGDIERAITLFRRSMMDLDAGDVCYVADLLAPIYVMLGDNNSLTDLLDKHRQEPELAVPFEALRAIGLALGGQLEQSRILQRATESQTSQLDDAPTRARIYQRLALAAYRTSDPLVAARLAARSARLFASAGSYRSAAASYSVAYNVHHAVTMDVNEALDCAVRMTELGKRAGDESFVSVGLVSQYEIFAELGREAELIHVRNIVRRRFLPDQYGERFASGVADILPIGWRGDFAALRVSTIILQDAGARSRGEQALCIAIRALAEAGLGETERCRRFSRAALFAADHRSLKALAPADLRYLHIARGLAGAGLILSGNVARGRRALRSGSPDVWHDLTAFELASDGAKNRTGCDRFRGYIMLIEAARRALGSREDASALTRGEMSVLRFLADGLTAPQIACETKRSVHTVRAHTRAIISKLGVHGRYAAVKQARQMGVLPA